MVLLAWSKNMNIFIVSFVNVWICELKVKLLNHVSSNQIHTRLHTLKLFHVHWTFLRECRFEIWNLWHRSICQVKWLKLLNMLRSFPLPVLWNLVKLCERSKPATISSKQSIYWIIAGEQLIKCIGKCVVNARTRWLCVFMRMIKWLLNANRQVEPFTLGQFKTLQLSSAWLTDFEERVFLWTKKKKS